jgi:hypothetical protein
MQKTVWLAILAGVTACGLWATLVSNPDARAREARFDACRASLSGACLADLAVEIGLQGTPPSPHSSGVTALRVTSRDAAAHALIVRAGELEGKTTEEARRAADALLAAPRLADAVRKGMSPADAYAAAPEVRYGDAYIAALDLLGNDPYGSGFAVRPPTAADRAAVARFAELLVSLAGGLSGRPKEAALEYAAELHARLGQRDQASQIFLGIERDGDWNGVVSPLLMDAEIGAFALKQCRGLPDCRARVLQRAAMLAASDAEAEAMLREAFAIHLGQQGWPDFDKMGAIVDLAVSRKNPTLALALARDLDRLAQTRAGVFPSFPHIAAARALLLAGATEAEVRAALDRAEAEMPGSGRAVIGSGHMGPITWGGGIGSQARREQANLWARVGDLDRAARLMAGIEDPPYAWGEVLGPDLAPETLDQLLLAAEGALAGEEFLHLRAQTAAEMVWLNGSPAQRDWALRTVRDVLPAVDPGDDQALATCRAVARVAQGAGDDALWQAALTCAAETAAGHAMRQSCWRRPACGSLSRPRGPKSS